MYAGDHAYRESYSDDSKKSLSGCPQCMRWTMFTLNILLFISAALIVGYASYLLSTQWNVLSTDNYIPIIMFVLFAILLIVSCLGSVATCRLSRCLLIIYSLILAVCLILQVVVIVLIVTSNFNTDSWLEDRFNDLSTDDKQLIEKELECCGWNETVTDPTCTDYTDYCQTKVEDYAKRMKLIGMILGAAILVFEIGGIIVSCVLIRSVNDRQLVRNDSYIEYSYMDEPNNQTPYRL